MIWLLRHGDAEDGDGDDAARRLTPKGERQAEAAGRTLAALGVEPEVCLSSPKARAWQTAEIGCRHLNLEVEECEQLRGGQFDPVALAAGRDALLVGHEPDFSDAIEAVTGARVKLKKGGLAGVQEDQLQALMRPSELRRIADCHHQLR